MRCKLHDLVIMVKSTNGNEGAFGTIIEFLGQDPIMYGNPWFINTAEPCWLVQWKHPIRTTLGRRNLTPCPDSWLQPIRGNPTEKGAESTKELCTFGVG